MDKIYILLGGNIGDVLTTFTTVKHQLKWNCQIINQSSIYLTKAWGNTNQPDFYNQVLEVDSPLSPEDLLDFLLSIETKLGRLRELKNDPRTIDIDILFYGYQIIQEENLTIPHPKIRERKFTLIPLNEIASNFVHPVFNKTIHQLLIDCIDELEVDLLMAKSDLE